MGQKEDRWNVHFLKEILKFDKRGSIWTSIFYVYSRYTFWKILWNLEKSSQWVYFYEYYILVRSHPKPFFSKSYFLYTYQIFNPNRLSGMTGKNQVQPIDQKWNHLWVTYRPSNFFSYNKVLDFPASVKNNSLKESNFNTQVIQRRWKFLT